MIMETEYPKKSETSNFTGQCFNNVQDIPDEVNCLHCGEDIEHSLKNAIVIYRIL